MPRETAALMRNQQNAELPNSLFGEREIDDASAMVQYLIDDICSNFLRRNAKKAIAVGGLLVNQYNYPALAKFLDGFINAGDGHGYLNDD